MKNWALVLVLVVCPLVTAQIVLEVPTQFPTIQAAIDAAADGDTVCVGRGLYLENLDFLGKAIMVESSSGADATIVDGSALTLDPLTGSVVVFRNGEGPGSVLRGFTLTGGTGTPGSTTESGPTMLGGGIYVANASPRIVDCIVEGNAAQGVLGIYWQCGPGTGALVGCVVRDNGREGSANHQGLYVLGPGDLLVEGCEFGPSAVIPGQVVETGNVRIVNATAKFSDCRFTATGVSAAVFVANNASALFEDSTFEACSPLYAVMFSDAPVCTLRGCTFRGNQDGALISTTRVIRLERCVIAGNTADRILQASGPSGEIYGQQCTVVGNTSGMQIGTVSAGAEVRVDSSIWRDNTGPFVAGAGLLSIVFTNLDETAPTGVFTNANFDADPLFADAAGFDFRLQPGSPCIDAGNPTLPLDDDGTTADCGALAFDDLGASFVRGDFNDDGVLNIVDAVLLAHSLLGLAPAPECNASADVNLDDQLDLADIIRLLGYLHSDGAPPPSPFPECGFAARPSPLSCDSPPISCL